MIKSLRSKPLRIVAIAVLPLALLGTACGSDGGSDDDTPANTEASDDAPADDSDGGDESGASDDVEAFCDDVEEFVETFKEVLADPSSGDIGALTAQSQELASSALELSGTVDEDDNARLQECTKSLSDLGGG